MTTGLALIVRERIREGCEADYDANERAIASVSRRLRAPHPYLAMVDTVDPRDIWWLTVFASVEHRVQVEQAYAGNTALMEALTPLGARKPAFRASMSSEAATLRPDLGAAGLELTGARVVVVGSDAVDRRSTGAVFLSESGAWFTFAPAAAASGAPPLGARSRVLAIRPEWSHADPAWRQADRAFWGAG